MSIESITEKLKEENEIDQLDKTVESIKINIVKVVTEWRNIAKSVNNNIILSSKISKLEDKYLFHTVASKGGAKKKHAKKKEEKSSSLFSLILSLLLLLIAPLLVNLFAYMTKKIGEFFTAITSMFSDIEKFISDTFSNAVTAISNAVSVVMKPPGEDKQPEVINTPTDTVKETPEKVANDEEQSPTPAVPEKPSATETKQTNTAPAPAKVMENTPAPVGIANTKIAMPNQKNKNDTTTAAAISGVSKSSSKITTGKSEKKATSESTQNQSSVSVSKNEGKGNVANTKPPEKSTSFFGSIKNFATGAASAVAAAVSTGYKTVVEAFTGKADAKGLYLKPGVSLDGTDPKVISMVGDLQKKTGKKLLITSGKRPLGSYGGGPSNPHVVGKAVDISVKSLTDTEQQEVSKVAVSMGFTGLGAEGDHLHYDISHATPMTWGADYHYPSAPEWAKNLIKVGGLDKGSAQEGDGPQKDSPPTSQPAPQQQQKKAAPNKLSTESGTFGWYHSIERHFGVNQPATGSSQHAI